MFLSENLRLLVENFVVGTIFFFKDFKEGSGD
jgi:hypothetical protein